MKRTAGGVESMVSVHNPDQYMWNLRQVIAQGRKKIGFLVGAGAPAGVRLIGTEPLIPAIAGLTAKVLAGLQADYAPALAAIIADIGKKDPNIEDILSRVRSVSGVVGKNTLHALNGEQYDALGRLICTAIGNVVSKDLPPGRNAYTDLISWISGSDRRFPIEIFTTNYDLLFEQAFERSLQPYFDGFVGGSSPFFDGSSVANNDLPPRWARLWKLHGSLGWELGPGGEVTRHAKSKSPYCVYPEHMKYEQTRRAPYSALFDRLSAFLREPDTILISNGFSFGDAHITTRIVECLVANPAATVFAFQYNKLEDEVCAKELARHRGNVSVYARDGAIINSIDAPWRTGEPPAKNWSSIQQTYWKAPSGDAPGEFLLGDFAPFATFFAAARAEQGMATSPANPATEPTLQAPAYEGTE
jgi:hypothetical protein